MKKKIEKIEKSILDFMKIKSKYINCHINFLDKSEEILKKKDIKRKIDFSNLSIFDDSYNHLNDKYNVQNQINSKKIKFNIKELKDLVNTI